MEGCCCSIDEGNLLLDCLLLGLALDRVQLFLLEEHLRDLHLESRPHVCCLYSEGLSECIQGLHIGSVAIRNAESYA